jgi:D-amino peptidase
MAKNKKLKVFISVDIEGITGVINFKETDPGDDYQYYRKLMTGEANAAIEGALEAGATEIIVRDSHSSARNIIPDLLNEKAKLIREWSAGPLSMMEGIDKTFDAVVFIGYHAKAMTPNGTLKHTMEGDILDLRVNDISLPEAGWNGLIAGYYDVPVAFLAGDLAACNQAKELFGNIETVAVKEGIGDASINLHPEVAKRKIKAGVKKALSDLKKCKPFKLNSPFTMQIDFKTENRAYHGSWYPGAKRIGNYGLSFTSNEFFDLLRFFMLAR